MNERSLSQSYIKNQQSSWIDDPFEVKGAFTGVKTLSHERNLSNYAEELVATFAIYDHEIYTLSLSDLPEGIQNELARLYIEHTGRDIGECVYGDDFSIENPYTCALLAMLKDDSPTNRNNFAQITRRNIIAYYHNVLQEVIDEACNFYIHSMNEEAGFHARQCMDSGEVYWGKI